MRKGRAVRVPQPVPPGYYFEIGVLPLVNLGYTRAKVLFGATYLLKRRRQFASRLHPGAAFRTSKTHLPWRRLLRSNASGCDVSFEIIFGSNRRAGDAAKHRDRAYVRQRVRHRPLKQSLGGSMERCIRSEVIVERLQRRKESLRSFSSQESSGESCATPAFLFAIESPQSIKIAEVSENLAPAYAFFPTL